jgi:hypothetical protein
MSSDPQGAAFGEVATSRPRPETFLNRRFHNEDRLEISILTFRRIPADPRPTRSAERHTTKTGRGPETGEKTPGRRRTAECLVKDRVLPDLFSLPPVLVENHPERLTLASAPSAGWPRKVENERPAKDYVASRTAIAVADRGLDLGNIDGVECEVNHGISSVPKLAGTDHWREARDQMESECLDFVEPAWRPIQPFA